MNTQRFQVRQAPHGTWVEDTKTGKRATQVMSDERDEQNQLKRPAAKQRARKIARRMNHKARMDA
jgi:hypothetical protein